MCGSSHVLLDGYLSECEQAGHLVKVSLGREAREGLHCLVLWKPCLYKLYLQLIRVKPGEKCKSNEPRKICVYGCGSNMGETLGEEGLQFSTESHCTASVYAEESLLGGKLNVHCIFKKVLFSVFTKRQIWYCIASPSNLHLVTKTNPLSFPFGWHLNRYFLDLLFCLSSFFNRRVNLFWKSTVKLATSKIKCLFPAFICLMGDFWYKGLSAMQETWVWSLGWEDPRRREWQPTPVFLAWKIPWTEEPGGLQSMGSQRVGHDWMTYIFIHTCMYIYTVKLTTSAIKCLFSSFISLMGDFWYKHDRKMEQAKRYEI